MTNISAAARTKNPEQHAANLAADRAGPDGSYTGTKGSTVFGIGRPSVVDFEEHSYATRAVPEDMRSLSPDEMRSLAQQRGRAGAAARAVDTKKSE